MRIKTAYIYFISYSFQLKDGDGYGCCTVRRATRITTSEDIASLKKVLEETGINEDTDANVIILNYIFMKKEYRLERKR